LFTFLLSATTGCTPSGKYTGTPVKVLIVFIQFTDIADDCPDPAECAGFFGPQNQALMGEPRHNASEYRALLETRVNAYYQKATYGQVYFDFDVLESPRKNGWWASPHTLAEYNHENPSVKQEAVNIAYTQLGDKVLEYERILVVYGIQGRAGQTIAVHYPTPDYAYAVSFKKDNLDVDDALESGYIPMIVTDAAEDAKDDAFVTLVSHELGHQIGAPDLYYDGYPGVGYWDIMDDDSRMFHFSAWTKLDRMWLSWNANTTKMPCNSGTCEITTVLDPVEVVGNNALTIPISEPIGYFTLADDNVPTAASAQNVGLNTFIGIMAECRMPINGDESIPEQGVLVTFSNPNNDKSLAGTMSEALTNESFPYALLQPGEQYYSDKYKVRIINESALGDSKCTVRAERDMPLVPDVYISQTASPGDGNNDPYRSIDIWNDIDANGPTVYPSSQQVFEATTVFGPVSVPEGVGDPISLTDWNYANYLVHNSGGATAKNVKVNVYLRQAVSVSVQDSDCGQEESPYPYVQNVAIPKLIGTYVIAELKPGQTITHSAYYQTTEDTPVEIEVEIEPVDGEVNTFNNIAYETNNHFYNHTYNIADAPGYDGMGVTLDAGCKSDLPFIAQQVPGPEQETCKDWDFSIDPVSGKIAPGETVLFDVKGVPSEDSAPGDTCRVQMCVMMPLTSSYSPVACMDVEARTVEKSTLTCSVAPQSLNMGEAVQVTGALDPKLADIIGLSYIPPEGESVMVNVDTNGNGEYEDSYTPDTPGVWNVRAEWVGDDSHAPTNSELCRFVVAEQPQEPIFTPSVQANCREGSSVFWKAFGATALGATYPIVGVSPDGSWYFIQFTESRQCWVKGDTGAASGDLAGVPAVPVREITPTLTPTATCVMVCTGLVAKICTCE
jgi:M6 family metalloprotease-like protein